MTYEPVPLDRFFSLLPKSAIDLYGQALRSIWSDQKRTGWLEIVMPKHFTFR